MSLCPSWIKCAVSLRNMYTNNSSYAYVSTTKFIDRVYLRFQLRVGSRTIMTLYSYMGNIMAECNRHLYICTYIHKGWLYNQYRGKYHGDDRAIVNRDTQSGHCLADPGDFYSSDVYNLPLASAK